jgi:pyrroloquinoline-quinone synthase
MTPSEFWPALYALLDKYDLLKHPFYQAWRQGVLRLEDLREYAIQYYHHVALFPAYLREFATSLSDGELKESVLRNLDEEMGMNREGERAHNLLWLDFAVGTGAQPADLFGRKPIPEVKALTDLFLRLALSGDPAEVLAAFFVYESQVPRIAREKASVLRSRYGLSEAACRYFTLHSTADVAHAMVWREQLQKQLSTNPGVIDLSISAAERTAKALWLALDAINDKRMLPSRNRPHTN